MGEVQAMLPRCARDPGGVDPEVRDPGDQLVAELVIGHSRHQCGVGARSCRSRRGVERIAGEAEPQGDPVGQCLEGGQLDQHLAQHYHVGGPTRHTGGGSAAHGSGSSFTWATSWVGLTNRSATTSSTSIIACR